MNIMEVAHRAGVSTATVSRVINGTAFVTPETAERVRQAIADLNFYPDTNARTLGSGRSSLFGLIISDITNPYFPELVKAFEDIAVAHGKEVLIANTNYDPVRMEHCVVRMLQRKVDGVAILTSEMDEQLIRNFSRRRIPLVFMDTTTELPNVSIVRVNYESGVRAAMHHLIGLGHRDLGFLSGPLTLSSARVRQDAFHRALTEHRLPANPAWVQQGDHRVEGGRQAMQRILAGPTRPHRHPRVQRPHRDRRHGSHPRARPPHPRRPLRHGLRRHRALGLRAARPHHHARPPRRGLHTRLPQPSPASRGNCPQPRQPRQRRHRRRNPRRRPARTTSSSPASSSATPPLHLLPEPDAPALSKARKPSGSVLSTEERTGLLVRSGETCDSSPSTPALLCCHSAGFCRSTQKLSATRGRHHALSCPTRPANPRPS